MTEERDRIQREYEEMKADLTKKLAETQEQVGIDSDELCSNQHSYIFVQDNRNPSLESITQLTKNSKKGIFHSKDF